MNDEPATQKQIKELSATIEQLSRLVAKLENRIRILESEKVGPPLIVGSMSDQMRSMSQPFKRVPPIGKKREG